MREWWRDAVIYQVYPRSYQDDTGDGIGDLQGITRRLPYIASLGVDCIWLSPIFTSPQKDMGYDVSDYKNIDPVYGTLDDFDALIAAAHALGIKVISDQVLSHSSDVHPWFQESRVSRDNPRADWYVWADPLPDGSPPTNWHSHFGGPAWEFAPARGQYYLHNFLAAQPDLNFHNPDVVDAVLDICKFWLDRGMDGFRLDTVNYYFHDQQLRSNPPAQTKPQVMATDLYGMQANIYNKTRPENLDFLQKLRSLTDQYDDIMMVGEVGEMGRRSTEIMGEYTAGNSRLHMAYSFAMLGPEYTADHFRSCIQGFQDVAPNGHPSWSFSNHDVPRHVTRWADHAVSEAAIAKQAAAMLLAFEGTIGIYQGEELGQVETVMEFHELTDPPALRYWPAVKGRDGCRTPMVWDSTQENAGFSAAKPWLPVKPAQIAHAVDLQEADPDSVLHFYRAAIAFRKSQPCLGAGKTTWIDIAEPILAFTRTLGGQHITCVYNLSKDARDLSLAADASIVGPSHATLNDGTLSLPGTGFAFISHTGAIDLTLG